MRLGQIMPTYFFLPPATFPLHFSSVCLHTPPPPLQRLLSLNVSTSGLNSFKHRTLYSGLSLLISVDAPTAPPTWELPHIPTPCIENGLRCFSNTVVLRSRHIGRSDKKNCKLHLHWRPTRQPSLAPLLQSFRRPFSTASKVTS